MFNKPRIAILQVIATYKVINYNIIPLNNKIIRFRQSQVILLREVIKEIRILILELQALLVVWKIKILIINIRIKQLKLDRKGVKVKSIRIINKILNYIRILLKFKVLLRKEMEKICMKWPILHFKMSKNKAKRKF